VANALKSLGWWFLGALLLLAPLSGELVRLQLSQPADAAATAPANAPGADENARWMGAVGFEQQSAGEAIPSGQTHRDLTFHLDGDGPIEIIARAFDEPLRYRVFNGAGEETAAVDVPPNSERSLQVVGSAGRNNRVRIERTPGPEQATYQIAMRRLRPAR